jgi:hypothetical protein
MNYQQAVAKGRALLKRSEADQWELAELTYDVTTGVDRVTQVKWADDLGVTDTHVRNLAKVWDRFGGPKRTSDRSNLTFNECYLLASMSGERARKLVADATNRRRSVATVHRDGPRRDLFEDAREYMRDRRRARKLLKDPKIRAIVERELGETRPERPQRGRPPGPPIESVKELEAIRDRLNEMLGQMLDRRLPQKERTGVSESIDDVRVTLGWMDGYVTRGDRSFEDALDALLADLVVPTQPVKPTKPVRRPVARTGAEPAEATADLQEPATPRRQGSKPDREDKAARPSRGRKAG